MTMALLKALESECVSIGSLTFVPIDLVDVDVATQKTLKLLGTRGLSALLVK